MYIKLLRFLFLIIPFSFIAQLTNHSPFSKAGLGEFQQSNHAVFTSLGNTYSSYSDSNQLNFYQPASYSLLGKGQPIFSFATTTTFFSFWEGGGHHTKRNTSIHHFALGIPFSKRLGVGFGLKPFTSKGYSIVDKTPFTDDTLINQYNGTGNINDAFLGFSMKVLKKEKHQLSIGLQGSYLFGKTKDRRSAQLVSQKYAVVEDREIQLKAIRYEVGLQYALKLEHHRQLQIGIIYAPAQNLTSFQERKLNTAVYVDDESSYALIEEEKERATILFPTIFDFGMSYVHRPKSEKTLNQKRIPQLQVFTKISMQKWSEYQNNFTTTNSETYQDVFAFGLGIEFAPHFHSQDRTKNINYLSKMRYRMSWEFAKVPLVVNLNKYNKNTLAWGFYFPITNQKTLSSINIGFSYQNIETKTKGLWNEKNFGINFGVQIAPGFYDKWFKKYKID
ncbi:MAG: hypothetical protein HYU67_00070 [Flavobacteriia bacterium]|nr:hypothetical protein [Flavobacteriia bacterium]